MSKLSGLQQDVISLYRRILREAMKKDRLELEQMRTKESDGSTLKSNLIHLKSHRILFLDLRKNGKEQCSTTTGSTDPAVQQTTTAYAINEFRKQAYSVNRLDFKKIDYMIRKGRKQIKILRMPGVKLVSSTGSNTSTNNSTT
jgi:hypothetical protein